LKKTLFTNLLQKWGKQNDRPMPWKGEKNPYFIWLSEIILQQTRVAQGTKYFLAFKTKYPTINDLAKASEQEVLKLWEGLGYYSRARNLHFTAKYIVSDLDGKFPIGFENLLLLKGVGAYTAAAIASFAYNIPKAVVDGNVIRVLSRVFGIETEFKTVKEKNTFQTFADTLICKENPATYNQAIMDFGAQVCMPKNYNCQECIFMKSCFAFKNNKQDQYPLKKKKITIKERFFTFLIFQKEKTVFIEEQKENDIWKGLNLFPKIETFNEIKSNQKLKSKIIESLTIESADFEIINTSKIYTQKLTHQKINAKFVEIKLKSEIKHTFIKADINFLSKFAFPKIINVYLSRKLNN